MEKRKEVKQLAICAGTYPNSAIQFAKNMEKHLNELGFCSKVKQSPDTTDLRVIINVKDVADAKATLESMKKVGYSGYIF